MLCGRINLMITLFLWFFPFVFAKINIRRTLSRIVVENEVQEEIPSKVEKVEKVTQGSKVSQGDQVTILGGGDEDPRNRVIGILDRLGFL